MGTRADFYVGRGVDAEWLGSISWDGYPSGIDDEVLTAETEEDYRLAVAQFFGQRDDVTYPNEPWPWPWADSRTTDYAYAWDDGVYATGGQAWFTVRVNEDYYGEPDEGTAGTPVVFPDMSARKGDINHIMAKSGMIVVSVPKDGAR